MDRRRAPFYLRRTKEAMVYFPERRPDGTWVAQKIFTKRIPHSVDFQIDGAEFDLYRDVTRFVKRQSAKAAAQGDDPRARAVGFLMSLYQRRLASSTNAMRPAKASTYSAAIFSSTTTSPGTRIASSSAWAASTVTANARIA